MKVLRFYLFFLLIPLFCEERGDFSNIFIMSSQVNLKTEGLKIGYLRDIAITLDNKFVFVDFSGKKVVMFGKNGNFERFIGGTGEGPGEFQLPKSVAIDKKGRIYIADNERRRINIYDKEGNFLNSFIITGLHWVPYVMKIDSVGNIYMGGYKEDFEHPFTGTWIHKYNSSGKYLKSFFPTNEIAKGQIMAYYSLCSFDIDSENYIYATQATEYKIYKYDSEGNLLKKFGKAPPYYIRPQKFPSPEKWQLMSDKEQENIINSWTHLTKVILVKNKYLLLVLERKEQAKKGYKFLIDIFDKNGDLIAGGIGTNYKLLCKDKDDNLYFLIYTNEEEPEGEPRYIIGKYSLKLE